MVDSAVHFRNHFYQKPGKFGKCGKSRKSTCGFGEFPNCPRKLRKDTTSYQEGLDRPLCPYYDGQFSMISPSYQFGGNPQLLHEYGGAVNQKRNRTEKDASGPYRRQYYEKSGKFKKSRKITGGFADFPNFPR